MTEVTFVQARANLTSLLNQVAQDREIVIISRGKGEGVALVAASELSSLLETAHLLRSPKNARRLLTTLNRAAARKLKAESVEKLRREIGFESKEQKQ